METRLKEIDDNLTKQSIIVKQISLFIKRIDSQLDSTPSNNKEAKQSLINLESMINDCEKEYREELEGSNPYIPQEIPSSFLMIAEPIFDLELMENQNDKNGRNNGFGSNLSQMAEVKYKDTFSTCDNHTISNNLEVPMDRLPNNKDFINCNCFIIS